MNMDRKELVLAGESLMLEPKVAEDLNKRQVACAGKSSLRMLTPKAARRMRELGIIRERTFTF